jgi:ribonucleoside-diphosphate reductase subunit M2
MATRYTFFPITDEKGYEFYKKQECALWSADELDFIADRSHYSALNEKERHLIDAIFSFFLLGEGAISNNIVFRLLQECKTYEEMAMLISQLHVELVHAETYGLAATTMMRDADAVNELVEKYSHTPGANNKIKFIEKWMADRPSGVERELSNDPPRWQRLVAAACTEGIFFPTLFCPILWFKSRGLFSNFVIANELIMVDESLHRDFYIELIAREDRVDGEVVLDIVKEAVQVEMDFIDYALPEDIVDLTNIALKEYAQLMADNLLRKLGFEPFYSAKNVFTWMNGVASDKKSNIYEMRSSAYKKKVLSDVVNWKSRTGLTKSTDVYRAPELLDF